MNALVISAPGTSLANSIILPLLFENLLNKIISHDIGHGKSIQPAITGVTYLFFWIIYIIVIVNGTYQYIDIRSWRWFGTPLLEKYPNTEFDHMAIGLFLLS